MGLDLYIEAQIKEKKTGRIISNFYKNGIGTFGEKVENGFYEVCWWCSWMFCDIRQGMIDICNRHLGTSYTDQDFDIPVPQTALREIYALLVKRCVLSEDEAIDVIPDDVEWMHRSSYEKMNLENANKLHDVISVLQSITFENNACGYVEHIPDERDKKAFEDNPQAYDFEFNISNSY